MAITTIELPALWRAGMESGNLTNWSSTIVTNNITSSTNFFSWSTSSSNFGQILGFDYELLQNALRDDANSTIKLKMRLEQEGSTEIGVHRLEEPPEQYTSLPSSVYNPIQIHNWDYTGWIETDVTYLRQSLTGNETGITFLPFGMLDRAYEPSLILEGNWVPQRPTLNSPIGGVMRDRTKVITFEWDHNGIFAQSEFELRYRKTGTSTWTTVSAVTQTQTFNLSANSLTSGEYEWQVRTTMTDGNDNYASSQWSSTEVFTVTEATNAPIIVEPESGVQIPTQDLTIEWETVENQEQIQVELVRSGNVVNSTTVTTSNNRITLSDWLSNNTSYVVRLRVISQGELWSDWAERNITVSYTSPVKPNLVLMGNNEKSTITVYIENPTPQGTEPAVTTQDLFRRRGNEVIKLAEGLNANASFIDHTPASDVEYEYYVRVRGDNGTNSTSDMFSTLVKVKDVLLSMANDLTQLLRLKFDPGRSLSLNLNATKKQFNGRKKPVTEFGELIEESVSLNYLVEQSDLIKLKEMAMRQETVLYRDSRGRKYFSTIDNLTINDYMGINDLYTVSLSLYEVDYKEGVD
ncbi:MULTISPECIES: hypothetical protein [Bacillaceae]|uniref:Uncharacterized protein n=1 Tax=Evansella alkalicola TaxID=745819 RepID=A0ABS6K0E9_9BACI|nr:MULTISPECIES: hypothetical protein [Bacillaceae]MBU9724120.1 hypothetical protein [Bacillus alkalicola]